jgi:hypothetical protein
MELKDNPYLKQEDYAKQYKESMENLKNHPEFLEFDRLCYETFNTVHGKKFLELVTKRFLMKSMANINNKNYTEVLIWSEGFKDAYRMINDYLASHEQRIQAGANA